MPYAPARKLGELIFAGAYIEFHVTALIHGGGDFYRYLYSAALRLLTRRRVPTAWPPTPPAWSSTIPPEELDFLVCAYRLHDPKCRQLVFLSFYAGLDIDQIAYCLQAANPAWTAVRVEAAAKGCWLTVIRCMSRTRARKGMPSENSRDVGSS
jgi:hypothetical protein